MNIYIILIFQLFIASGTHIVAKAVATDLDAVTLTFIRSIISSIGLYLLIAVRSKGIPIERKDWKHFAWLGFLGLPVNQFLYLYGIHFTTAANGALLYAATPIFVLGLSNLLLKEAVTRQKVAGVLIAFAGVTIVIFERGLDFSSDYTYGNLIILVAVIAWALFTVQGRPMIIKYGALRTTSISIILGGLMFFPFGLFSMITYPLQTITTSHWFGIIYLGLGTSIIGYFLWYYALGKIETSKVAVFANGQPVLATILAIIFLNYVITASFVVGGIITIAGVFITQTSKSLLSKK